MLKNINLMSFIHGFNKEKIDYIVKNIGNTLF